MVDEKIIGYQPCTFCKGTGRKQPADQTCEVEVVPPLVET